MASLPTTALENHPVGTTGLNGLINGNWERLEAILLPIAANGLNGFIGWDASGKKFTSRAAQAALTYAASMSLNLAGAMVQTLTLTGNVTFATSNLTAGATLRVVITCDSTLRTLTFPASWKFVGAAAPASIAASKVGILEILSTSTLDSLVVAKWTVEP